jgi:Fe(II)/alpha-ketoglutarate-dependent arginine beta-hydroxylase
VTTMEKHHIDAPTAAAIDRLAAEAAAGTPSVHDTAFQRRAAVLAHELPRDLREVLVDFRLREPSGALLLSGIPVDDDRIGPTPAHWYPPAGVVSPTLREEIIFTLLAQLLGDPFGYASLHNGLLVHNIIPVRGYEKEQIAFGSEEVLEWHTEEAFHPYRSAYTALMCLRNPYGAPTTYCDIADLEIDEADRAVLRQPLFETRPSGSHSAQRNELDTLVPPDRRERAARSFAAVAAIHDVPNVQPVLYGAADAPYLCVDPDCMTATTEEAAGALQRLVAEVNRKIQDVTLSPGTVLFMDNHRAIHGRKPFTARFDGNDRWLKRMNIARDLRPSRAHRLSADDRVIY